MLKIASCRCASSLSRGKCRDSCGHACADWESRRLWGARYYSFSASWWDLRLSYRRGKISRGIVLLRDYARPLTARQTQTFLCEQFHWDIFEHPTYSPDLAPSDFFLFPKMKEHLAGKRFANNENLNDACWIARRPHGMKGVYYYLTVHIFLVYSNIKNLKLHYSRTFT